MTFRPGVLLFHSFAHTVHHPRRLYEYRLWKLVCHSLKIKNRFHSITTSVNDRYQWTSMVDMLIFVLKQVLINDFGKLFPPFQPLIFQRIFSKLRGWHVRQTFSMRFLFIFIPKTTAVWFKLLLFSRGLFVQPLRLLGWVESLSAQRTELRGPVGPSVKDPSAVLESARGVILYLPPFEGEQEMPHEEKVSQRWASGQREDEGGWGWKFLNPFHLCYKLESNPIRCCLVYDLSHPHAQFQCVLGSDGYCLGEQIRQFLQSSPRALSYYN